MRRGAIVAGFVAGLCAVAFLVMSSGTGGALGGGAIGGGGAGGGGGNAAALVNLGGSSSNCTGSFTGFYLEQWGNSTDGKSAIGLCVAGVRAGAITIGPNGGIAQCSHGNIVLGQGSGLAMDQTGGCAGDDALNNTMYGAESGVKQTTAMQNTYVGSRTGHENVTGIENTCVGQGSCYENLAGTETALGYHSHLNQTGNAIGENVAIGWRSMEGVDTTLALAAKDTCVGSESCLVAGDAVNDVCMGYRSCTALTTGDRDTCVGNDSCLGMTSSIDSTCIGRDTCKSITSENGDTCVGAGSCDALTDTQTTAIGWDVFTNATTSTNSTGVGALVGATLTTGDKVTLVGANADVNSSGRANCAALGASAVCGADNTVQLGDTAVTNVNTSGTYTGLGLDLENTTGSVSSNAVTTNAYAGVITDDTTNINASTTRADITWTNSRITAASIVLLTSCKKPTDANVSIVAAVTPGAGTATLSIRNVGTGNLTTDNDVVLCYLIVH